MSDQFPPARPFDPSGGQPPVARAQRPAQKQDTGIRDIDPAFPADALLQEHGARVLDPVTAVRPRGDNRRLRPTVYVAGSMLVPAELIDPIGQPLAAAA